MLEGKQGCSLGSNNDNGEEGQSQEVSKAASADIGN